MATAQQFLHALSDLVPSTPGSPGIGIIPNDHATNQAASSNPISSAPSNATASGFRKMEISLSSLVALLVSLAVKNQDVLKLMLIGFVIESSRRFALALWTRVWTWITTSWYISVHFESNDDVYHWMMHWLGNQSVWETSRDICINTAYSFHNNNLYQGDSIADDTSTRQLKYFPVYDVPNWFKYKGTWISVTRCKNDRMGNAHPTETLTLCLYTRKHSFLREILQEAKAMVESEDVVNIYSIGNYNDWYRTSSRRKRPLRSVILEPEIKEGILADAEDFLSNEEWYVERGIPYRRGYLLHGVPGSGKTSLIHSIAGELGLDVYIVSLSKPGLGDSELNELFCSMPSRSILLIEDIDAVFRKVTAVRKAVAGTFSNDSRGDGEDPDDDSENKDNPNDSFFKSPENGSSSGRGITLSGLLNALDGIAASEGRLLFATTNCFTALDEALRRPGRMDVHVEFTNATKWQARELFWSFFEPCNKKTKEKVKNISTTVQKTPTSLSEPGTSTSTSAIRFAKLVVPEVVSLEELSKLSDEFGSLIPADVFSVASLQGYLMLYKERPRSALKGIEKWVEEELVKKNLKEKIRKEKAGVGKPEKKKKKKEKKEKKKEKDEEREKEKVEEEKVEGNDELEPNSESEQSPDDAESSSEIVEASAWGDGSPAGNGMQDYPKRPPGRPYFRRRGQGRRVRRAW